MWASLGVGGGGPQPLGPSAFSKGKHTESSGPHSQHGARAPLCYCETRERASVCPRTLKYELEVIKVKPHVLTFSHPRPETAVPGQAWGGELVY